MIDQIPIKAATNYQICSRCVMDTTDPAISFDAQGVCNHCHTYDEIVQKKVFTGDEGKIKVQQLIEQIKQAGSNKDYDCLIGVSGGVDSTFVAYKVKELGLRPLAVHLDNGWDSELAVNNIEKVLKKLDIELYTHVIDWEEFKDLQLAFLRASTPDSEIPSDHAIISLMYQMAQKVGVKYIISGINARTESHLPQAWSQGLMDWKYIKNVHQQFGQGKLKTYPHTTFWAFNLYRLRFTWIDILNYIDYVKKDAMKILEDELGWIYYGGKHYESIYTRFYQGYILPKKFGYDKRKMHFSSLICSGEMTREEALAQLTNEIYPLELQAADLEYVLKKFGLTEAEFEAIMQLPAKTIRDYPAYDSFYQGAIYSAARSVYQFFRPELRPLMQ
jgi:N-acetyl sugar amidotransferase